MALAGVRILPPDKASTPTTITKRPILLNVGSLEPVKDQTALLHAIQKVHHELPHARLIVAGEGNLRGRLESLAINLGLADCVEFRGEVPHHLLPELYRSASVFVQSSLHESQGMALLEAAACGLPIVGTRVGALADLAPEAAVATEIGNVRELAAALIELLRQPDRAVEIGRAARSIVEREYALARSVDRFLELYRSRINAS